MSKDNVRTFPPNAAIPSGLIELAKEEIGNATGAYLALIDADGRITEYTTNLSFAEAASIATAAQRHALIRLSVVNEDPDEEEDA